MGGNVRVGLEDSLWIGKGQLAKINAEQVAKIRRILEELGLEIATPEEARTMLQAQGQEQRELLNDWPQRSQEIDMTRLANKVTGIDVTVVSRLR